jgi:hypothetical protein
MVKYIPSRPCIRTRCELEQHKSCPLGGLPGRLAVRPFRASQDFGGSVKMFTWQDAIFWGLDMFCGVRIIEQ